MKELHPQKSACQPRRQRHGVCCFVLLNQCWGINERSRGFLTPSEPREHIPTIENRRRTTLPWPPLDNLGWPDPHPPPQLRRWLYRSSSSSSSNRPSNQHIWQPWARSRQTAGSFCLQEVHSGTSGVPEQDESPGCLWFQTPWPSLEFAPGFGKKFFLASDLVTDSNLDSFGVFCYTCICSHDVIPVQLLYE